MQFNGIGREHGPEAHQITHCMHDHSLDKKGMGGAGLQSGGAGVPEAAQPPAEGQLSLSAWLERTWGTGKRILRGIWNGSEAGTLGDAGTQTGSVQAGTAEEGAKLQVQKGMPEAASHTAQVAAASAAVTPANAIPSNPYFAPVESGRARETMWHKLKVRCRDVTGQLARHLPGKFFDAQARNSFQPKQEQRKEDLRKHSKYREDTLEIDCVLTDDSYLLDSYDRKGEYSKLSAKK